MALTYNMRALAAIDNDYVFWSSSEADADGSEAPETIVDGSATVVSVSGEAEGTGTTVETVHSPFNSLTETSQSLSYGSRRQQVYVDDTYIWLGGPSQRALLSNPLSTESSSVPNNFPSSSYGWRQIGSTIYFYGGRASPTDDTYAHGDPFPRIFSAPASDISNLTEETNTLPVSSRTICIKNDNYVFVLCTTEGSVLRAPLNDPTNFTDVGTLPATGFTAAAYQVNDTVYLMISGSSSSTIYSSSYSDLVTWTSTGDSMPTHTHGDHIVRCGYLFLYKGGQAASENSNLYIAYLNDPTKWYEMSGAFGYTVSEGCPFLGSDGFYYYGGYQSGSSQSKIWYNNTSGNTKQILTESYSKYGSPRPLFDY